MLQMRLIIIMLLMMLLAASCKGPTFPIYQNFCDISFEFERCRCRDYNLNTMSPIAGTEENWPLQACDGVAGFMLEDIAIEIRPKAIKIIEWHLDNDS